MAATHTATEYPLNDMATTNTTAINVTNIDEEVDVHSDNLKCMKIKHKGTPNKPAPQGHDYEIKILTLTYLDAMEKMRNDVKGFHSYIATEVLDTSPFEDVVYVQVKQDKATSCYVQAKHSLKKFPIKLNELLTDSTKRENICLVKYFKSLRDIKRNLKDDNSYYTKIQRNTNFTKESHQFVIFTNRPLHNEVKGLQDVTDDILFYTKENREGKMLKIKISNESDSLYHLLKTMLVTKVKDVTEREITEFFDELIFATEQPNVEELKKHVEKKLREITGQPDTKWIAGTLAAQLSRWAHQKDGWFMDRNTELFEYVNQHLNSWKQTVCTLNILESIRKCGVLFKDDIKECVVKELTDFLYQMTKSESQMCVVYYKHLKLTEIKIAQAISDKIKYEVIFLDFDILSFEFLEKKVIAHKGLKNVFVLTVNTISKVEEVINVIKNVYEMFEKYVDKKAILVIPSRFCTDRLTVNFKKIKDKENSLHDLKMESQEKIYKERAVLFEGHRLNLRLLIDDVLENNINGQILEDLIKGDVVIKTRHVVDKFERENIQEYYIPQRLERICINKDKLLADKFNVIYGECCGTVDADGEINDQDVILITENKDPSIFERICEKNPSVNIHWLLQVGPYLYWYKSRGLLTHLCDCVDYKSIDNLRSEITQYYSLINNQNKLLTRNEDEEKEQRSKLNDFKELWNKYWYIFNDDRTDVSRYFRTVSRRRSEEQEQQMKSPDFSSCSSFINILGTTELPSSDSDHIEQDSDSDSSVSLRSSESSVSLWSRDSTVSLSNSILSSYLSDHTTTVQDIESRVVVITAEPGMGKSTLLSHFYRTLQSTDENKEQPFLVVKTNLDTHSTQLKKISDSKVTIEDAIEFLLATVNFKSDVLGDNKLLVADENGQLRLTSNKNINGWNALHLKLFANFYNQRKIIVLLDGFDETAPLYRDPALNLLEALTKTMVQKILITTRPYGVSKELERRLDTFAYSIVSFSGSDQRMFFQKFWKHKLRLPEEIDETKLTSFINKCEPILFRNSNLLGIHHVFVSIPQHIEMVATVYQKYFQEYLQTGECENMSNLNIYSLYDEFFQTKFGILHKDANSDKCTEEIKYGKLRKISKKEHGQLAMMELFEEEKLQKIVTEESRLDLTEAVRNADEKTGILYVDRNGEPRFVHRTFAEYFAADLLADMLQLRDTKQHKQYEIAVQFLYEMVTEHNSQFKMVFNFLNYKLVSQCKNRDAFYVAQNENFAEVFENVNHVYDCLNRSPLHLYFYSIKYLNSSFKTKFKSELYIKDKLFDWTALHYLAMNNECMNINKYNLPVSNEVKDNPGRLQDIKGKTPLMYAIERDSKAMYSLLNEIPFAHHLRDFDGNTSLHYFTAGNEIKTTKDAIVKNKQVTRKRKDHMKNIVTDIEDTTIFGAFLLSGANFFEQNLKKVTPCVNMLRKEESCELLSKFILNKQNFGQIFAEFWTELTKVTIDLNVKYMEIWDSNLTTSAKLQDCDGKTILHHAVTADLSFDKGVTECFLKYEAVKDIINVQDHEGKTALHYALCNDSNFCIRTISSLLKYGADLSLKDNEGNTLMQMFFNKTFTVELDRKIEFEIFASLPLDLIIATLRENVKVRYFINICDKKGKTALHYAVMSGDMEKISSLLKYKPNVYIEDNEGKIPADGIIENDEILDMFNNMPNLREQYKVLLLSMVKTNDKDRLLLTLSRYKNIAYFLIENEAINVNSSYGGKTLCSILTV